MSYHSTEYLNSGNILVGNVSKTGRHAWWYDERLEDKNNPTHFDKFIPISVVEQRLFGWETLESLRLEATFSVVARDYDGQIISIDDEPYMLIKKIDCTSYKALGREDWVLTGVPEGEESGADAILAIQGETYGVHQLKKAFLQTGAELFGGADEVGIVSAGLLKWGRRAWMTAAIPERLHNKESGMDFIPQLTFSTSFDSSLPTSIVRTIGTPVCDNTLDYELMKAGESGKFILRHTKNSVARISDAKQVLGLLTEQADHMDKALAELSKVDVSEGLFVKWLDAVVPVPEIKITEKMVSIQGQEIMTQKVSTNALTIALNKRDRLSQMWDNDPRVTPWKNTKLGVLQLWNTFQTHESTVRGSAALGGNKMQARVEANMMRTIQTNNKYSFAKQDAFAMTALDEVLSEAAGSVTVMAKPKITRKQAAASN